MPLLVALGNVASAQNGYRQPGLTYLLMADEKTFLQTGPNQMNFLGGNFRVTVNDGNFVINGCIGNGDVVRMFPNLLCPLGTTAFLLEGDVDGDGNADTRSFWSISDLVPARAIAPGFGASDDDNDLRDHPDPAAVRQQSLRVSAGPAGSGIINALIPGVDTSVTLTYNVLEQQNQKEYVVSRYRFNRAYNATQLNKMYSDVPGGVAYYQFNVPRLVPFGSPPQNDTVRVLKSTFVEAYPGPTPVAGLGAFQVTNNFINGALEFDPRFRVSFTWTGISFGSGSTSGTVSPLDRLYFSLRDAATDRIIYPLFPPDTPDVDRAAIWLQDELLDGGFSIGPFFNLGIFEPGQNVIGQLEVRRGRQAGGNPSGSIAAHDYSERIFRWPVRFVDTYEGFAITAFPPGTPENQIEPNFDFDGDGYLNFEEFAFNTDPSRPEDNPSQDLLPVLEGGEIKLTVRKRLFTGGRYDYYAEVSTNGGTSWTRVVPGTPNWEITVDNDQVLEVTSTVPPSANPGRIRARVKKLR